MPLYNIHLGPGVPHPAESPAMLAVKRKLEEQTDLNVQFEGMEQEERSAKKLCKEVYPSPAGDSRMDLEQEQFQPALNLPTLPPQSQNQQLLDEESIHGCMKDVAVYNGPPAASAVASHSMHPPPVCPPHITVEAVENRRGMWMDMDGETYCPLGAEEVEEAVLAMESDCCPDPAQYGRRLQWS